MSMSNKSLKNGTNSAGTHGNKEERIMIPFINNVKSLSFWNRKEKLWQLFKINK